MQYGWGLFTLIPTMLLNIYGNAKTYPINRKFKRINKVKKKMEKKKIAK
jgi:hypothetical protein